MSNFIYTNTTRVLSEEKTLRSQKNIKSIFSEKALSIARRYYPRCSDAGTYTNTPTHTHMHSNFLNNQSGVWKNVPQIKIYHRIEKYSIKHLF